VQDIFYINMIIPSDIEKNILQYIMVTDNSKLYHLKRIYKNVPIEFFEMLVAMGCKYNDLEALDIIISNYLENPTTDRFLKEIDYIKYTHGYIDYKTYAQEYLGIDFSQHQFSEDAKISALLYLDPKYKRNYLSSPITNLFHHIFLSAKTKLKKTIYCSNKNSQISPYIKSLIMKL